MRTRIICHACDDGDGFCDAPYRVGSWLAGSNNQVNPGTHELISKAAQAGNIAIGETIFHHEAMALFVTVLSQALNELSKLARRGITILNLEPTDLLRTGRLGASRNGVLNQ